MPTPASPSARPGTSGCCQRLDRVEHLLLITRRRDRRAAVEEANAAVRADDHGEPFGDRGVLVPAAVETRHVALHVCQQRMLEAFAFLEDFVRVGAVAADTEQ